MIPQEAIIFIKECGLNIENPIHDIVEDCIVSALEKQIPKKPEPEPFYGGRCTVCNALIPNKIVKYCSICGQALDWSDIND